MTDRFDAIRQRVGAREAAEHYGLTIVRNRTRCIWHSPDRHPSLSFKDGYCKCFACGAGGSAIDIAMRLFGLDAKRAAERLNQDFRLNLNMPANRAPSAYDARRRIKQWQRQRLCALSAAAKRAREDLRTFADAETAWDAPVFVAALRAYSAARTEMDILEGATLMECIEMHKSEVGTLDQ